MIEEIKEPFKKVIQYSQKIEDPKVDDLLEQWYLAKKPFMKKFGEIGKTNQEQMIFEMPNPVSFKLDHDTKQKRFADFVGTVCCRKDVGTLGGFLSYIGCDAFYQNAIPSSVEGRIVGDDGKPIQAGTKVIKAFKHFVAREDVLRDIQDQASMLIQEDKIEGTLCFSVHPLDFLSASANTYNWRSCHALDGEYRGGNLSYMTDSSTIICYIKSKNDAILPGFPADVEWNSKKWRMFLYLSEDKEIIFAGRQYPFSSTQALDAVLSMINIIMDTNFDRWTDAHIDFLQDSRGREWTLDKRYIMYHSKLFPIDDIVEDKPGSLQYNDLLHSHFYFPTYAQKYIDYDFTPPKHPPKVQVGGRVMCLCCGKKAITGEDTMRCEECYEDEDIDYCDCCGEAIYDNDNVYFIGESQLCSKCYTKYTAQCSVCGAVELIDDMYYNEDTGLWSCNWCYE